MKQIRFHKLDYVTSSVTKNRCPGRVKRCARDYSWYDVEWNVFRVNRWTSREIPKNLNRINQATAVRLSMADL
jgi:hypothetical protein